MQFNFYEEYTQFNTIELLKIILQQGDYQSAAIDAAKQILAERNISETDIEIANIHVADVSNKQQNRQQKIDM